MSAPTLKALEKMANSIQVEAMLLHKAAVERHDYTEVHEFWQLVRTATQAKHALSVVLAHRKAFKGVHHAQA